MAYDVLKKHIKLTNTSISVSFKTNSKVYISKMNNVKQLKIDWKFKLLKNFKGKKKLRDWTK